MNVDSVTLVVNDVQHIETGYLIKVSMLRPCLKSDLVSETVKVMEYEGGVCVFGPVSRKIGIIAPVALTVEKNKLVENISIYPYLLIFPTEEAKTKTAATNLELYKKAKEFLKEKEMYA